VSVDEMSADMTSLYSLTVTDSTQLESYDDCMYRVTVTGDARYAVKYYNASLIDQAVLSGITRVLSELKKEGFNVPEPLNNLSGTNITQISCNAESKGCKEQCLLVVFGYVEGSLLGYTSQTEDFWEQLGQTAGQISLSMKFTSLTMKDYTRQHPWDPNTTATVLLDNKEYWVPEHQQLFQDTVDEFTHHLSNLSSLPTQLIHGDLNENNLVVTADRGIGVIDFNDMVKACRVFELGHLLCYMLLSHDCDLKVASAIYQGWFDAVPELEDVEIESIYTIILARVCLSTALGNKSIQLGEGGECVKRYFKNNLKFIEQITTIGKDNFNFKVLGWMNF